MTSLTKMLRDKGYTRDIEEKAKLESGMLTKRGRPVTWDDERRDAIVFLHKIGFSRDDLVELTELSKATVCRIIKSYYEDIGDRVDYVEEMAAAWLECVLEVDNDAPSE